MKSTSSGPRWTGEVRFVPEMLDLPLRWKAPRRIFVNSMSDLFHEKVADREIDAIFAVMSQSTAHTFQVLTKRAERMLAYLAEENRVDRVEEVALQHFPEWCHANTEGRWPLPNVHLGVSVENQATADERIPLLLQTPAAVRWVSYEPALGAVRFERFLRPWRVDLTCCGRADGQQFALSWEMADRLRYDYTSGVAVAEHGYSAGPTESGHRRSGIVRENRLDWLVCGGESGPGARPPHPDWFRSTRDQCMAAGVRYFFKQWGEWAPVDRDHMIPLDKFAHGLKPGGRCAAVHIDGHRLGEDENVNDPNVAFMYRVGKKNAGALLDGREWREFPEGHILP